MKSLLLLFFITISFQGYSQNESEKSEQWEAVDVQPDYPDGISAFMNYVRKNLEYPKEAKKKKIEGKVFVEFVIDSTGSIREETVKVIQGLGHGCDEEAVRLIKNSPDWIPGRVSKWDKDVPVRMVLPIYFKR